MSLSLKKNAFLNMIRAVMSIVFPLISFPYASRVLMPEGIGVINFSNAVVDVFLLIAGVGIGNYAIREGSKIRNDQNLLNKFAKEMLCINLISMAISFSLFLIALFFVSKIYALKLILLITASKIFFETIGLGWILTVKEDFYTITVRSIVFQVISLCFLFVFVRSPEDLWKYAVMGILYSVGTNTFCFFYCRKYINIFEKTKVELKKHFRKIVVFFGMAISSKIYSVVDSIMLGLMVGTTDVGFYAAANKLIYMVLSVLVAVLGVFLPRCSSYVAEHKIQDYENLVRKALNTVVFYSIPAAVGLFILCRPLIKVFSGDSFLQAYSAMQILCGLVVINAMIEGIQTLILLPQNKEKYVLIGQNLAGITNFFINIPFILIWKVKGAALATLISQIVTYIYFLVIARKFLISKSFIINLGQVCISTVVMFFVARQVLLFSLNKYMQIICVISTGCIVYALMMLLLRNRIALRIVGFIKAKFNSIFRFGGS